MARVSGIAIGVTAAGVLFAYAGLRGKSVLSSLQAVVRGASPSTAAAANPIAGASSVPSGGSGGTPGAALTTSGPGGITPRQAYLALTAAGVPASAAVTLTAIGGVESDWNVNALNNTPATGDYSIGVWQINYYGSLYGPRTAEFGPPQQLIGNLKAQARAAAALYSQSGFGPWQPDITSGKINAYMAQALAAAAGTGG